MEASGRTSDPVALVTGASSGIGLVTARALAQRGWTVVCASRASGGGADAVAQLRRETGSERVHFLPADLSRPRDAVALAEAFRRRFDRLDALVNNAGAFVPRRLTTEDGLELTFALNHLGPFALTAALLPELEAAAGRVVTVSSGAAMGARLQLDDPNSERRYLGWAAYAWSKLCNQLFTLELARRLAGSRVSAYVMHPGFVATSFGHTGGWMGAGMRVAQRLFARSPERGADTLVWLVSAPAFAGASGGYYIDRRERPVAPKARDEAAQRRLWAVSEELLEELGVRLPALEVRAA